MKWRAMIWTINPSPLISLSPHIGLVSSPVSSLRLVGASRSRYLSSCFPSRRRLAIASRIPMPSFLTHYVRAVIVSIIPRLLIYPFISSPHRYRHHLFPVLPHRRIRVPRPLRHYPYRHRHRPLPMEGKRAEENGAFPVSPNRNAHPVAAPAQSDSTMGQRERGHGYDEMRKTSRRHLHGHETQTSETEGREQKRTRRMIREKRHGRTAERNDTGETINEPPGEPRRRDEGELMSKTRREANRKE